MDFSKSSPQWLARSSRSSRPSSRPNRRLPNPLGLPRPRRRLLGWLISPPLGRLVIRCGLRRNITTRPLTLSYDMENVEIRPAPCFCYLLLFLFHVVLLFRFIDGFLVILYDFTN